MKWEDLRGNTRTQHVTIRNDMGMYLTVLCRTPLTFHVPPNKKQEHKPHCRKCIRLLKGLIIETKKTGQLELSGTGVNYQSERVR